MSLIIKAAQAAEFWHRGQKRKYNGRPYIEHPARVANRMMLHKLADEINVAAAWLHDVVEDCDVSQVKLHDLLCHSFESSERKLEIENCEKSQKIVDIVQSLTNPSKDSSLNRAARKEMDREHLRNAPQIVKIIKMIDRIDNLRDLSAGPIDFQKKYANESLLLANVIGDADSELYKELCQEIDKLM